MNTNDKNIANLKVLGAFSKRNQSEIAQVVELYKARKIERLDTAKNIIVGLSSQGKKKQSTAKDKLKFYNEEYVSRAEQYEKKVQPPTRNSYIQPKTMKKYFVRGGIKITTTYCKVYKGKKTEYAKEYESLVPIKKVIKARSVAATNTRQRVAIWDMTVKTE